MKASLIFLVPKLNVVGVIASALNTVSLKGWCLNFLARSENLPTGLYILPSVISFF